MVFRNWSYSAIVCSALGLIPMLGCFGSSDDKGDNSGVTGKPLPHDGTATDDVSKPRDNAGTITPEGNKPGFGSPIPKADTPPGPPPK